jgi:hypothetical protein
MLRDVFENLRHTNRSHCWRFCNRCRDVMKRAPGMANFLCGSESIADCVLPWHQRNLALSGDRERTSFSDCRMPE